MQSKGVRDIFFHLKTGNSTLDSNKKSSSQKLYPRNQGFYSTARRFLREKKNNKKMLTKRNGTGNIYHQHQKPTPPSYSCSIFEPSGRKYSYVHVRTHQCFVQGFCQASQRSVPLSEQPGHRKRDTVLWKAYDPVPAADDGKQGSL